MLVVKTPLYTLEIAADSDTPLRLESKGAELLLGAPVLPIDGRLVVGQIRAIRESAEPRPLPNGVVERTFEAELSDDPATQLFLRARTADDCPILRLRYALRSLEPRHLTTFEGAQRLRYVSCALPGLERAIEVRLSEWNDIHHAYTPREVEIDRASFADGVDVMGPILAAFSGGHARLFAYEHGSPVPQAFLAFRLDPGPGIALEARMGNYYDGQPLFDAKTFVSPWMQIGIVRGGLDELAAAYRRFVLLRLAPSPESRKPYVFYNTWNLQERTRYERGGQTGDPITQTRLIAEIEAAAAIGVEVFVIDAGWDRGQGDWELDPARFPHGLGPLREVLAANGMKLGLWFAPLTATVGSGMLSEHRACVASFRGKERIPSGQGGRAHMCLVSPFGAALGRKLGEIAEQEQIDYFKLDGVEQWGCDAAGHGHGDEQTSREARAACHAYAMSGAMTRLAEAITRARPSAIIDYDVTEAGRTFGLEYLAAGKYFLHNNGPYYQNLSAPMPGQNWNVFFQPGPSRGWICRSAMLFDRWLPSTLFLTHFFPDEVGSFGWTVPFWMPDAPPEGFVDEPLHMTDPASFVLGPGGVWGDLASLGETARQRWTSVIGRYKRVRDRMHRAAATVHGRLGGSPEAYEKIDAETGQGVFVVFSNQMGEHRFTTRAATAGSAWASAGGTVDRLADGRALLTARFEQAGAVLFFFGAD